MDGFFFFDFHDFDSSKNTSINEHWVIIVIIYLFLNGR